MEGHRWRFRRGGDRTLLLVAPAPPAPSPSPYICSSGYSFGVWGPHTFSALCCTNKITYMCRSCVGYKPTGYGRVCLRLIGAAPR
jgi:hypothetical protein